MGCAQLLLTLSLAMSIVLSQGDDEVAIDCSPHVHARCLQVFVEDLIDDDPMQEPMQERSAEAALIAATTTKASFNS